MSKNEYDPSIIEATKNFLKEWSKSHVIIADINSDETALEDVGSGVLVKLEDRYFIATAAHVLEKYNRNGAFTIVPMFNTELPQQDIETWSNGYSYNRNYKADGIDIGCIELKAFVGKKLEKHFVTIDKIDASAQTYDDELWIVVGFPGSRIKQSFSNGRLSISVKPFSLTTDQFLGAPFSQTDDNKENELFVYLNFDNRYETKDIYSGKTLSLGEPYGISGTAFWKTNLMNKSPNAIWSPNDILLSAIDCSWNEKGKYIKGVRIYKWLEFVRAEFLQQAAN